MMTDGLSLIDDFNGQGDGTALDYNSGRGWWGDVFGDGSPMGYWGDRAASQSSWSNGTGASAVFDGVYPSHQRVSVTYGVDFGQSAWEYKVVLYLRVSGYGSQFATGYRLVIYPDGTGYDYWEIHGFYDSNNWWNVVNSGQIPSLTPGDRVTFDANDVALTAWLGDSPSDPILSAEDFSFIQDGAFGLGVQNVYVGLDDLYFGEPTWYPGDSGPSYLDAAAALVASGALAPNPRLAAKAAAVLVGSASLAPSAKLALRAQALLSGAGSTAATARMSTRAAATLTGSGATTPTARLVMRAAAALAGAGALSLTPGGLVFLDAAAALTGQGALQPSPRTLTFLNASAGMTGSAALVADATLALRAAAVLEAAGDVLGAAYMVARASALLGASGALSGDANLTTDAAANLGGLAELVGNARTGRGGVLIRPGSPGFVLHPHSGFVAPDGRQAGRIIRPRAGRANPGG